MGHNSAMLNTCLDYYFLKRINVSPPYSILRLIHNLYFSNLSQDEFLKIIPLKFPRFQILAFKRFPNTNKYKDLPNIKIHSKNIYCLTIFKLDSVIGIVFNFPFLNFRKNGKFENKGDNSKCPTSAKQHPAVSAFSGWVLYISIIKPDGT